MSLTEEDVRQALIEKAKKFWSKKAIETLAIEKVEHDVCYHVSYPAFCNLIWVLGGTFWDVAHECRRIRPNGA